MNNQIETVPSTFYTSEGMMNHLRRLIFNQNRLRDLDPKVQFLRKLRVLGIAMT